MKGMAAAFGTRRRYEAAQRLAQLGRGPLAKAALPGWSAMRDLPEPPKETFRDWWKRASSGEAARRRRATTRGRPAPSGRRARRVSAKADILARVRERSAVAGVPRSRARTAPPGRSRTPPSSTCSARPSPSTARPCTATVRRRRHRASDPRRGSARRRAGGFRDLGLPVIEDHDLSVRRAGRRSTPWSRAAPGDRRHRDDRPRLRRGLRPPRAHARPGSSRLHRRGARGRPVRARRDRRARPGRADHARLRSERHLATSSWTASRACTARACST